MLQEEIGPSEDLLQEKNFKDTPVGGVLSNSGKIYLNEKWQVTVHSPRGRERADSRAAAVWTQERT